MRSDMHQPLSSMESAAPSGFRLAQLRLWIDPTARSGYENMATDELLLRQSEPWLRIYGWRDACVSFGYFDSAVTARSIFPGASQYIRRWTGGGIVDHRHGITYTLTLRSTCDCSSSPTVVRAVRAHTRSFGSGSAKGRSEMRVTLPRCPSRRSRMLGKPRDERYCGSRWA